MELHYECVHKLLPMSSLLICHATETVKYVKLSTSNNLRLSNVAFKVKLDVAFCLCFILL